MTLPVACIVDLGSNAIRFLAACPDQHGHLKVLHRDRSPIRIGDAVFSTGKVGDETQRIIDAIQHFQNLGMNPSPRNSSTPRPVGVPSQPARCAKPTIVMRWSKKFKKTHKSRSTSCLVSKRHSGHCGRLRSPGHCKDLFWLQIWEAGVWN